MSMQVQTNRTTQTTTTTTVHTTTGPEGTTGAGTYGEDGSVPEATSFGMQLSNALASFAPKSSKDFEVLLAAITQKMKDVNADVQTESVLANQEVQQLHQEENTAKAAESAQKMKDAAEANEKKSFWEDWSQISQIISIALTVVAAGAAAFFLGPAGFVLAGLLLASAATQGMAMLDSHIMSENGGKGMMALTLEAVGFELSDEDIRNCAIASAVINAVIGITLALASGNAAKAVSSVASLAHTVKMIQVATATIDTATTLSSAAGTIGTSVTQLEAAEHTSDAKEIDAAILGNQAVIGSLDAMIEEALAMLMAASDAFNAMMDQVVGLLRDNGDTLSRARLTG